MHNEQDASKALLCPLTSIDSYTAMSRRCRSAVLPQTLSHFCVGGGPAAPPAEAAPAAKISEWVVHYTLPEGDPDPAAPRMGLSAKKVVFFKRMGGLTERLVYIVYGESMMRYTLSLSWIGSRVLDR
jgi:hypothetical protein